MLLAPVTLDVQDGTNALVRIVKNMTGQGVQEGIEPFSTPLSALDDIVGTSIVIVFLIALVAGIVGVVRREPVPVVWAVAALATGAFAYARPPNVHYFAPAFVFAALAMLWLLQREPRARTPLLAWVLILYVVWPAWDHRLGPAAEQEAFAGTGRAGEAVRRRAAEAGRGRARAVVLAVRGCAILRARADLRRPRAGVPVPLPAGDRGACARSSSSILRAARASTSDRSRRT